MSKEIKQKADDLIYKFIQTLKEGYQDWNFFDGIVEEDAIKCAILHQERLIDVLDKHRRLDNSISIKFELSGQKAILTELKSRL